MPDDARPLFSFDLDGVLARPPLGLTLTMNRDITLQPVANTADRATEANGSPSLRGRLMGQTYYRLRYRGRRVMPGALDAVRAAALRYRLIVLSGRSQHGRAATEAWLRGADLLPYFDDVVLNDSGLPSPRFKEQTAARLGIVRHADDDPATAALLARAGVRVDLIDWPRNRDLPLPEAVTRREGLVTLGAALREEAQA